jgi:hypothetical protein
MERGLGQAFYPMVLALWGQMERKRLHGRLKLLQSMPFSMILKCLIQAILHFMTLIKDIWEKSVET